MVVVENELLMRQRCRFWRDYIIELNNYTNDDIRFFDIVKQFHEVCDCINKEENANWWDLCNDGFIIFFTNYNSSGKTYIAESYVKPESRRKGVMTFWVRALAKEYGDEFLIEILNNNKAAFKFWISLGTLIKISEEEEKTTYNFIFNKEESEDN